jgi:formate hydrogenlyase subunit 3/multisubunit Na+/H+ antiporter MnhD subunit
MNAIYYIPIIIKAFFRGDAHRKEVKNVDPCASMLIPLLALALGCIIFGIFANLPLSIIDPYVHTIFSV